jgi:hypothetical protein
LQTSGNIFAFPQFATEPIQLPLEAMAIRAHTSIKIFVQLFQRFCSGHRAKAVKRL